MQRPRRVRRLALASLSVLLALLLAEIGLRIYARATQQERGLTWHADYGWAYLPRIKKRGAWWGADEAAWTNSRGWRDAEAALEPAPGTRRIVALGDSFTFGMAVDYGQRFSEVLERDLSSVAGGVEVVNLGLNASGTDQQLRILEVEGQRYRPDVVLLVAFLANDLVDIGQDRKNFFSKPWYRLEQDRLALVEPEPDWKTRLRCASYLAEVAMRWFDRRGLAHRVAEPWRDRDTVPLFVALARRMDEVCRGAGAHFLVALIHPRGHAAGGPPEAEERARRTLVEEGLAVLETYDDFAAPTRAGVELYASDGHWNEAGHALFAKAVETELEERGWLPR